MKLRIFTDWWSRWNPWNAWIWVYITDADWKEIEKRYKYLWVMTNNEAEYTAVVYAIKRAIELWSREVELFSDSNLIVNQLNWNWKIKEPRLRLLYKKVYDLVEKNELKISFTWIERRFNKEADRLSNVAMDKGI